MTGLVLLIVLAGSPVAWAGKADPSGGASTKPARKKVSGTQPASQVATTKPATSQPATQAAKPKTLSDCRKLYMKGKYKEAAAGYEGLMAKPELQVSAAIGMADVQAIKGKYTEAIKTLRSVEKAAGIRADWHVALAEALRQVGRYKEALTCAEKANELRGLWAPTIFIRGQLLETLGRREEAAKVYKTMEEVIDLNEYRTDARSLIALGGILDRYAVLTSRKASEQASNILHNYFQEAYQKADKGYWQANVAAGLFLLSKHQPAKAAKEFEAAAKLNSRIPDVFVGMAALELRRWRFERCLRHVKKALEINPNHTEAHLVKAICHMQWRKFRMVPPILEKALSVNPNHLDALSLMAAVHIRTRHPDKAQPYIRRVMKINPRYANLPNTIGQWLAAGRQYEEARKFYRQAIELAPKLAGPLTNLGSMYMQTGDEAKAKEILTRAHALDDFRGDVVNYLNVLRKLENFRCKETKHFIVKVNPQHDAVLLDQICDHMERIYPEVCGDFEHEPSSKTMIEIFPTHAQFSQRISGRGWIGTVGACTGRVIALTAPSRERSSFGTHNWANVLRHEFTHTVTLSATKNRIPHWFTEACAVWQQPDKRNFRYVRMLVGATRAGRLFPVKEMDWGFMRPRRRGDRSLAYAQAEWTMEYIITSRGYQTIINMLKGFRDGLSQAEVFEKIVGVTEAKFDKGFRKWAKEQVKEWGFNPEPVPDLAKAAKEAKEKPQDPAALARHAVALYARGPQARKKAETIARKALELDENNTKALAVVAGCLSSAKKYDEAIRFANKLESLDRTGSFAPRVLAQCYISKRSWANAIAALELLKQRQHLDSYSYEQLAKIYVQLGRPAKALPNLIYLHRHTIRDPKYARQIAEIYRTMEQDDHALKYFKQIVHINPYEASAYQAMASIYLKAERFDEAISAVNKVCLLEPDSAQSWAYMAVVRYRTGKARDDKAQLRQAKQDAEKALEIDPDSRARQLIPVIDQALNDLAETSSTAPATTPASEK